MGSSFTCLCSSSSKEGVLVMNQNGDLIKFKKGVLVKEILAIHAGYNIIRCGSDRPILSNSTVLESNRLYFLIPEELVLRDDVYDKYWEVAKSKGYVPIALKTGNKENNLIKVSDLTTINGQMMVGQFFLFEASQLKKHSWKPALQTIPEIVPSPVNVNT